MTTEELLIQRINDEYERYFLELKCASKVALIGRADEIAIKKQLWVLLKEQAIDLKEKEQEILWLADGNMIDGAYRLVKDYDEAPEPAIRRYIESIIHYSKAGVSGE